MTESEVRTLFPWTRRRESLLAAVGLAVLLFASAGRADDARQTGEAPFAVLSIAGFDRVLDDLEFVLGSAGQSDRMTRIRNVLLYLNELDGLDRDRPFGLLLYLPGTPPHDAQAVVYLPITDLDRLAETLRLTGKLSLERESDSSRFKLNTPEKTLAGLVNDDWIFLTEHEALLGAHLPGHLATAPADFDRTDAVLTLNRDGIPSVVLDAALVKLHADMERDLAPRDEETDAEHQLRSRVSRGIFELIERFLIDASDMTIGLEVSDSSEQAALEIRLNAGNDSPLSRILAGLSRPDSQFSAIARETAPLTIATTWRFAGEPADIAGELLARVRSEIAGTIEQPRGPLGPHPFERVLTALSETVDAGRLDGLVQFVDAPDGKFVLVAAAHVAQADSVAVALREMIEHHARSSPDGGRLVDINALEVDGVVLHRIRGTEIRRQDRRIYGDDVAFHVGAGRDSVWLAMGGAPTEDALRRVMLAPPAHESPDDRRPLPLLKASLHLSHWLALAGDGETERERKLAEAARRAFQSVEEDGVDLELHADETGLRLNVRADRGYIRLLGVVLAARIPQ